MHASFGRAIGNSKYGRDEGIARHQERTQIEEKVQRVVTEEKSSARNGCNI